MKPRYLTTSIQEFCFSNHKIAMLSGPRQCGKTTLGKMFLHDRDSGQYLAWDDVDFRRVWPNIPALWFRLPRGAACPCSSLTKYTKTPDGRAR